MTVPETSSWLQFASVLWQAEILFLTLLGNSKAVWLYVVMLTKERHGECKKVDRKNIYSSNGNKIQVNLVKQLIGSWESSGVVTIRPLCRWYHTWLCHADLVNSCLTVSLTCIYGGRVSPLCREYNTILPTHIK